MSWIALTDLARPAFNIRGIGVPADAPGARPPAAPHEILPTGTLMIELRYNHEGADPWRILGFRRKPDWLREIVIELSQAGRLFMAFRQGAASSTIEMTLPLPHRDSRIRLTYSWNAPERNGLLTVEYPEDGRIFQKPVVNPVPLPVQDVKALVRNGRAAEIDPAVRFIAVSDDIEPIGLGSGITGGSLVETTEGPVPVNKLRLGDELLTADSGAQPVRWIAKRIVPAMGSFRPVRLRAPHFGLTRDMVASPDHRLRLGSAEAEYLIGDQEVLVPAGVLVNGKHAQREGRQRLVTYYQILLDVHDCLLHDGIWTESLFVGNIAQQGDYLRSTNLAEIPATAVPRHHAMSRKALSEFETRGLAATLQSA